MTTSYFWKIEESLGRGRYIVHDGIYENEAVAWAAIDRMTYNNRMRPVLYRTGPASNGPVRAETAE